MIILWGSVVVLLTRVPSLCHVAAASVDDSCRRTHVETHRNFFGSWTSQKIHLTTHCFLEQKLIGIVKRSDESPAASTEAWCRPGTWSDPGMEACGYVRWPRHFVHQQWRQGKECLVFSFDNDSFTVTPTNSGKGSRWDLVKRCMGFLSSPGQPLYVLVLSRRHRLFSPSKQLPFHLIPTLLTQSRDKETR